MTQETCSAFALAALSGDTTVDRGPADARRRAAAQFGTPQLVEQLAGEGRDHDWDALADRGARILVDTRPIGDDPPPMRADRAAAGVVAGRVAVADDGRRQDLTSTAVYCTLVRTDQGWRVADVAFSDAPGTGGAGSAP
ncbi:hypothetical protein ALI22I_20190 [Saccharothrix sp. ALI-22-I]|uniref:hypothetical protein n=1 Tax=Saccharothrix sp. ALI-22-I TaxID=1933778 RepID=UPI00097C3D4A|nr:hypothetical protein [Saccharothrix sp. ALI-22-I]ONI88063.1 hypothetical protein ALI22I_20190 [Saccharothrix sp. ALI-22-I]